MESEKYTPISLKRKIPNGSFFEEICYVHPFDVENKTNSFATSFPEDYFIKSKHSALPFTAFTNCYDLSNSEMLNWLESNLLLNIERLNRCPFEKPKEIKKEFNFLRKDSEQLLKHIEQWKDEINALLVFAQKKTKYDPTPSVTVQGLRQDLKKIKTLKLNADRFYQSLS